MEMFLARAKPDQINKYLQQGWRVKMFQVSEEKAGGYSDTYIYIVLEKN